MSFISYLKDTRAELRHVAWPTQNQTIIYTILVVLISIAVALYVGLFDFLFTQVLERAILVPSETSIPAGIDIQQEATPQFDINPEFNVEGDATVEPIEAQ